MNELEFLRSLFGDEDLQFFKNSVFDTKILIVKRIEDLEGNIKNYRRGEIRK